jgi:hypothetical protein
MKQNRIYQFDTSTEIHKVIYKAPPGYFVKSYDWNSKDDIYAIIIEHVVMKKGTEKTKDVKLILFNHKNNEEDPLIEKSSFYGDQSYTLIRCTFSKTGKYILIDEGGWEWGGFKIFDLTKMDFVEGPQSKQPDIWFISFVNADTNYYCYSTPGALETSTPSVLYFCNTMTGSIITEIDFGEERLMKFSYIHNRLITVSPFWGANSETLKVYTMKKKTLLNEKLYEHWHITEGRSDWNPRYPYVYDGYATYTVGHNGVEVIGGEINGFISWTPDGEGYFYYNNKSIILHRLYGAETRFSIVPDGFKFYEPSFSIQYRDSMYFLLSCNAELHGREATPLDEMELFVGDIHSMTINKLSITAENLPNTVKIKWK